MKFKLQVVTNCFNILYSLVPRINQILLLFRISDCNRHVLDIFVLLGNHGRHIEIMSLPPDSVTQSVTCLTADPGVASLIPARSHTFMEIGHEIISIAILLPSADTRRIVVSYMRKYVHEVLVNRLVKLDQEKSVVR